MGAIAGILSFSGAPLDRRGLDLLRRGLMESGPDGEAIYAGTGIAMVHRSFVTGSADQGSQPVADEHGRVVCWNGRLDNRREVRRLVADAGLPQPSDGQLVLALYERFGVAGLGRLVGDFNLALWDAPRRRLVLANDAFQLRPVYAHVGGDRVLWSSRARPLLAAAGLAPDVDDDYVAGFLTFTGVGDRSPFRGVRTPTPGHALVIEPEGQRSEPIWQPDPSRRVRYRDERDYEEHFYHLLRQAVAQRIDGVDGPVTCDLSGGLDSSSIVCLGDRLTAEGAVRHGGLRTVSIVYDRCSASDERAFISLVEKRRGQPGHHVLEDDHPALLPATEALHLDEPSCLTMTAAVYGAYGEQLTSTGSRVLLRGTAGDQLFSGSALGPVAPADHFAAGRLGQGLRACREWSRRRRAPLHQVLWSSGMVPLLPLPWRRRLAVRNLLFAGWFTPRLMHDGGLVDRMLRPHRDPGFRIPGQRSQWLLLEEIGRYVGRDLPLVRGHVDCRFPFLDRRLIEFVLAIPAEQKERPGETKSVLRRALRGVLPEGIRQRRTKAGIDEAVLRALVRERRWISELFAEPRVAELGYVDGQAFRDVLARARHGVPLNTCHLVRTLALELWLRSLEGAGVSSSRSRQLQVA